MSRTEVFNQALSLIGVGRRLVSPSDTSREAQECVLWYDRVRRMVLSAAWWPDTARTTRLAPLEIAGGEQWQPGRPAPGFRFAYTLPQDYLYPRFFESGAMFRVEMLRDGFRAIMSNEVDSIFHYTIDQADESLWQPALHQAIVHTLAAYICNGLQSKPGRAQQVWEAARLLVREARANAANNDEVRYDVLPDWITARSYDGPVQVSRFIYPYSDFRFSS